MFHSSLGAILTVQILINFVTHPGGASGYNGPYSEAPPESSLQASSPIWAS